jgi:hypothetical protein
MSTVRRDFRSVPHRDASATWAEIAALITASATSDEARKELMSVSGIAASVIADQSTKDSPIVVTCEGPRTRIYCIYDDDSLDESGCNEAKLGFDATKGNWQVSLPVNEEDLDWIKEALKKLTTRVVARHASTGIEVEAGAKLAASTEVSIDMEGFLKA